ncbi:hypothetical protein PoB_007117800 [Plakobranchus ocellatus]|uniref:Uncharacterized protein n=1 Tax=Plakobranchus ocellatus TaxID=259542 RepID=A0AAV4DK73_9GAST|nr:hypothetical protein PoB_007117800 [Plakobranchus ocellatus]
MQQSLSIVQGSEPRGSENPDSVEGSCFKSIPVSSSRESYVPQVTPDRHPATARKLKDKWNIATWNIRTFLGHVLRRGKLEHLVTTGKFEGKRSTGRQREKIMDGLATWLGTGKVLDTLTAVKDRDLWRDMIANAYKQGT